MCADPQHEAEKCAITYDVSGSGPMLLRVCWERQVAVATVVVSREKRQPGKLPGSYKDAVRIKKISLQNTIRQLQGVVAEEQCFAVISAPLPREMDWEEAIVFRNSYGRRVRNQLHHRQEKVPTFVSIVTTRYGQPHGLRIYCPDDMNPDFDVFLACTHHPSPTVEYISEGQVATHIFELNNDLSLVPKKVNRYFVSRGHRLHVDEFVVGSIEEGRAVLQEKCGPDYRVTVVYSQPFGERRRAEYRILPVDNGPGYHPGLVKE
jgi:hypothetical protein